MSETKESFDIKELKDNEEISIHSLDSRLILLEKRINKLEEEKSKIIYTENRGLFGMSSFDVKGSIAIMSSAAVIIIYLITRDTKKY